MTPEQETLARIKYAISALPQADRTRIEEVITTLRGILATGGSHAQVAIALIGAELSAAE